jgi:hypothetical protein
MTGGNRRPQSVAIRPGDQLSATQSRHAQASHPRQPDPWAESLCMVLRGAARQNRFGQVRLPVLLQSGLRRPTHANRDAKQPELFWCNNRSAPMDKIVRDPEGAGFAPGDV